MSLPESSHGAHPAQPGTPGLPEGTAGGRPPLRRRPERAWLAGVSAGIADHLGWPVLLVRGVFVALALQVVGLVAYGMLWILVPEAGREQERQAPGLEAASHQGMRQAQEGTPEPVRRKDSTVAVALVLGVTGLGLLALRLGLGVTSPVFWPLALAGLGLALVWRQADAEADGRRRWSSAARVALGLALVGVAVSMVAALQIGIGQLPMVLAMAALMLLGIGIAAAPWVTQWRRRTQAAHERALLDQARADMAAHLHDSVLQTLALIQRQADDPKAVASLARRQERELRAWLYGDEPDDGTVQAALRRAASEIEDERGVSVELVCVGDAPLDEGLSALVRAAREAMTNAAKHSGTDRVDVYCEVEREQVECFVRDRGTGFDMEQVGDDRMGVRRSILGRMERHGGSARIRSAPGEGTEVRLAMERRG